MRVNIENLVIGSALAVASSVLLPIAKQLVVPLVSSTDGSMDIPGKVKSFVQFAREEVEDIYAEAQYERLKRQLDHEISSL